MAGLDENENCDITDDSATRYAFGMQYGNMAQGLKRWFYSLVIPLLKTLTSGLC